MKDLGGLLGWQGMSIQMRITEVTDIHEREGLNTQAETEGAIDVSAVKGKSDSGPEPGSWR